VPYDTAMERTFEREEERAAPIVPLESAKAALSADVRKIRVHVLLRQTGGIAA
jgi:hypothetical protein